MRITTSIHSNYEGDSHRRVSVFVNGANAGTLTLRVEEVGDFLEAMQWSDRAPEMAETLRRIIGCRGCASGGRHKHSCEIKKAERLLEPKAGGAS